MKYAIIKRRKLGLEVFTVVVQQGEDVQKSEFLSEGGAHNWLRNKLREASNDRS